MLSHIQLFAALWTVARQAPLTVRFPRQEYWSGCHFLLQQVFLTQGPNAPLLLSRRFFNTEPPEKPSKKRGGNIFRLEYPTVKRCIVFYQLLLSSGKIVYNMLWEYSSNLFAMWLGRLPFLRTHCTSSRLYSGGIYEIWRCLMRFLTNHDRVVSVLIFRFWKKGISLQDKYAASSKPYF